MPYAVDISSSRKSRLFFRFHDILGDITNLMRERGVRPLQQITTLRIVTNRKADKTRR